MSFVLVSICVVSGIGWLSLFRPKDYARRETDSEYLETVQNKPLLCSLMFPRMTDLIVAALIIGTIKIVVCLKRGNIKGETSFWQACIKMMQGLNGLKQQNIFPRTTCTIHHA